MPRVIIPPLEVDVEGVKCTILEVTEHEWLDNKKHYIVSVFCRYKGYRSHVFQLDVTSNKELVQKLKVEAAKMRLLILTGQTHVFIPEK